MGFFTDWIRLERPTKHPGSKKKHAHKQDPDAYHHVPVVIFDKHEKKQVLIGLVRRFGTFQARRPFVYHLKQKPKGVKK